MHNDSESGPHIHGCRFEANEATNYGGSVYIGVTVAATYSNCTFHGNTASSSGGAVYSLDSSTTSYQNCVFTEIGITTASEIAEFTREV